MKNLILFAFLIFLTSSVYGQNRFRFGVGLTSFYNPFEIGAQAKAKFNINDKTGTAGAFSFYLDETNNWGIDLDQHYNDFITVGGLNVSPFAGLNLLNRDDKNVLGLNLGLFSDFELSSGRVLYVEPKYTFLDARRFSLSVGMSF